jgi:hypothetical protein
MNLLAKFARLVVGLLICAALLFIPAGSLRYWQGWILLAVFCIPAISFSFYLYKHDPQLLERRLQMKEKITEQRLLVTLVKAFSLGEAPNLAAPHDSNQIEPCPRPCTQ